MKKDKVYPLSFAAGTLLIYSVLFVIPGLIGIGYSFTDWSAYSDELHFVGLENFDTIFSADENYLKIIVNTLVFTVSTTLLKNVLGLLGAVLLTRKIALRNVHRGMLFLPSILSTLIIGMVFTSILDPMNGILNDFLRSVGLERLALPWLASSRYAFPSVIVVDVWRGTGYIVTILIAGILSIPPVYYEAASIDGANGVQSFFRITLPLVMPTLTTTTVLNVIYGLKVFDMVYALTNGGPGRATTEVLYTAVFKRLSAGQYAVGTALSSVMFIFMVAVGSFMIRAMTKSEVEE